MVLKTQKNSARHGIVKSNTTLHSFLQNDGAASPTSATSETSTGMQSSGLTCSAAASLALTSAKPVNNKDSPSTPELVCGLSLPKPFAYYDQSGCLRKTSQDSSLQKAPSVLFSETLPRSGILLRGRLYQLPVLAHHTSVSASSSSPTTLMLPTPQVMDVRGDIRMRNELSQAARQGGCSNLREAVFQLPTPTSRDFKGVTGAKKDLLPDKVGVGKNFRLNPQFVEWMMGVPEEWTLASSQNLLRAWDEKKRSRLRSGSGKNASAH